MLSLRRSILLAALPLVLGACADQQLRFQPWAGVPPDEAAELKRGEFRATPQALFDAAATTLEHEPYLHWSLDNLDKADAFIRANAGLMREVQLRVGPVEGTTERQRLAISIPRRELKTTAKLWIRDDGFRTAYEPAPAELGRYRVVSADAVLDADYLRSFTWHVLHDHSQVPFTLRPKGGPEDLAPQDAPVAVDQAPAPAEKPAVRAEPSGDPASLPQAAPAAAP